MKLLLIFFVATMSLTCRSDIVWSWQTPLESLTAGNSTEATLWFGNYGGYYNLFDSVGITAADVGKTFKLTSSADESDYPAAVLSLTDGINNQIMIMNGASGMMGGWSYLESDLFANVPRMGPDLIGYNIEAIDLTIEQFSINYESRFDRTHTTGFATIRIEVSNVPEPSMVGLVGIGLGLFGVLRLTRKGLSPIKGS